MKDSVLQCFAWGEFFGKPLFYRPIEILGFSRVLQWAILALVFVSITGCADPKGRSVPLDPEDEAYENPTFGRSGNSRASPKNDALGSSWTIILALFTTENHEEDAAVALAQVRDEGQLPEAQLQLRSGGTALVYGSFEGATDPKLKETLEFVRSIRVRGGQKAYANAFAGPPVRDGVMGETPEMDLRTAAEQFGPDAIYTLQVGIYGRADRQRPSESELAGFRETAERKVAELREKGELAFYFHAKERSTVTVGVFGPNDHDPQRPGRESPRLRAAREAFPHNLVNGAETKEKVPNTDRERVSPSFLVAIPRERGK